MSRTIQSLRLPKHHIWLFFAAVCDVLFTLLVLRSGGIELNPLANAVLDLGGFPAMTVFKVLCLVALVVACEWIARSRFDTAHRLEIGVVGLWFMPPVFAATQLLLV